MSAPPLPPRPHSPRPLAPGARPPDTETDPSPEPGAHALDFDEFYRPSAPVLVRQLVLGPDVRATLTVPLSQAMTADPVPVPVSLAELRRRLAAVSYAADIPFDVTVEDGAVVAIEQVYVP